LIKRPWTDDEVEKLTAAYRRGESAVSIAGKLKRSRASVERKISNSGLVNRATAPATETDQMQRDESGDAAAITWTTSTPVRTVDDALAKAEVDTAVWNVDRFVVNSWESAAKQSDGTITKTPLWQVKLWLSRKKGMSREEFIRDMIAELCVKPNRTREKWRTGGVLAEPSIMDHHFGKLSWAPETGDNYDLRIARDRYDLAGRFLLQSVKDQDAQRILIPLGNDFYHVDTGNNTTTAGTPQDCDGRWQKAFSTGLGCCRRLIDDAAEIAPVDVVIVPGNHDRDRAFTLGVVLSALYESNDRVRVDNAPTAKKRYRWGETLIGFVHGDKMNRKRFELLPNEMAHHWPDDFAATSWREWHLGHLHSESEDVWRFRSSETIGDVIVRRLPSLSGTDRWHFENGYRSLAAAECHFFSDTAGRLGYRTISQTALETT
jgi:hypothetical protein